ncbi:unnamed protein product [Tenebrio molitor]|nr:unnamed protein product [Tenebrio molitor]
MLWKGLTLFAIFLISKLSAAEVSEKEYALMPPLFHLDNYDSCMLHGDEALYCMVTIQLFPINPNNTSKIWKIIEEVSSKSTSYKHDFLRHGLCLNEMWPNTNFIKKYDVTEIHLKLNQHYDDKYKHMEIKSHVVKMVCDNKNTYPVDIQDMIFGVFTILYGSVLIYATIYEKKYISKMKKNEEKSFVDKFTSAISIRNNWKRLITVELSTKDLQSLQCIQAVRVYATLWVIMIHTGITLTSSFVLNPLLLEGMLKNKILVVLFEMTWPMQIFFTFSTWLLTYNFLVMMEKKAIVTILDVMKFVIKRYFRLTPTMAFLIAFASTWMIHFPDSPFRDFSIGHEYRNCRKNWWTNLFYLNNFLPASEMCFVPGWYLAVNFGFYIFTLLLLYFTWKNPKIIFLTLASVLVLHFGLVISNAYGVRYAPEITPEMYSDLLNGIVPQSLTVYMSSYSHLSALVAGVTFGYFFYKYREQTVFTNKKYINWFWILTCVTILGDMMIPLFFTIDPEQSPKLNLIYSILWRSVFNFTFGLIIFAVTQGEGGFMKKIYESSTIYILGRLTFSAYITHTFILRCIYGIRKSGYTMSHLTLIVESTEIAVLAFLCSLILTLFIEMPVNELVKIVMDLRRKNEKSTSQ